MKVVIYLSKIFSVTFMVSLLIVISKPLGFLREILTSYWYGASKETDLFFLSLAVITIFYMFLSGATQSTMIPLLSKYEEKNQLNRFLGSYFSLSILISLIISLILYLGAEYIISLFYFNVRDITSKSSMIFFVKEMSVIIILMQLLSLITSFAQYKEKLSTISLNAIVNNIAVIVILWATHSQFSTNALALSIIGSYIIQIIFLILAVGFKDMVRKVDFSIKFSKEERKEIFSLVMPVMYGSFFIQLSSIIDKSVASSFISGNVSALEYASKLEYMITGIIITICITLYFQKWSKMFSQHDYNSLKKSVEVTIKAILLISVPMVVILVFESWNITKIVYGRGMFDDSMVAITSKALMLYSIGFFAYILRDILVKVYYSIGSTSVPMNLSIATVIINIISSIILAKVMGIYGIALSASISQIFITIMMLIKLNKHLNGFKLMDFNYATRLILVLIINVIIFYSINHFIEFEGKVQSIMYLGLLTIILFIVTFALSHVFKLLTYKELMLIVRHNLSESKKMTV